MRIASLLFYSGIDQSIFELRIILSARSLRAFESRLFDYVGLFFNGQAIIKLYFHVLRKNLVNCGAIGSTLHAACGYVSKAQISVSLAH
jgi:hypothetical protein